MSDFTLPKYDLPRHAIRNFRQHNLTWEEIKYATKKTEDELKIYLEDRHITDFWPDLSVEDWYEIVNLQISAEQQSKRIELTKGIAQIHDDKQDNAVSIPEDDSSSWQLYKKKLLDDGFQEETVQEIESTTLKILKRLSDDTREIGPIKGLVIGNVQSGKTANMAGLMAMAADWGWNMFIVLSGTIENLRVQTQTRLFNDLNQSGVIHWNVLQHLEKNTEIQQKAQNLHFEHGSNERYFTVCLKNSKRLENLIQWAQADKNKQAQMKILLIDDEADQAGINTLDVTSEERTKINALICNLVNNKDEIGEDTSSQYLAMNYVGYTATPYANILNDSSRESLYPRNFITTLAVSRQYFGPQQIFGYQGESVSFEGMDIVRKIDPFELKKIKEIHDGEIGTITKPLRDSICWFLCGVACMRIWGYKKPISMLIHTSQRVAHHKAIGNVIVDWFENTSSEEIISLAKEVWEVETDRFSFEKFREQYPTYDRDDCDINRYPSFEEVEDQIKDILNVGISNIELDSNNDLTYHSGIHLCIDNCENNGDKDGYHVRLAYPEASNMPSPAPAFIVIGGATLARGLTLEGLISSFFLRSVGQADTLMQMGRWFGYRKNYELLPRIWITDKTNEQFKFLAKLDQELRDEIQYMEATGRSPSEYGPKVLNSPKVSFIKITGKSRMQSAVESEWDYSGSTNQTYLFDNDEEILRNNIILTEEFIAKLGDVWQPTNELIKLDGKCIWRDIPFGVIKEFIERFSFCETLRVFNDTRPLLDWIQSVTDKGNLGNWNVIVSGKNNASNGFWTLPNGRIINKVNRSKKIKKSESNSNIIDIGVLRDPSDLIADVDIDSITNEITKEKVIDFVKLGVSKGALGFRDISGLQTTPQLIIYRIDKDSHCDEHSTTRENLSAVEDIIGLSIYIPGGNLGATYASKVSIKIENNVFDDAADLEGLNEN